MRNLHALSTPFNDNPSLVRPSDAGEQCTGCSRRHFLSASLLGAVGALLATACGDGVIGGGITGPGGTVNLTISLADYPALGTVGGMARLNGISSPIVVVRSAAGSYVALSLICPHQGTTVTATGGGFVCPNHGARFNATGGWTGGQRTNGLQTLTSTLNATAGTLTVVGTVASGRRGGDDD